MTENSKLGRGPHCVGGAAPGGLLHCPAVIDYSVRQDRLEAVLRLDGDGFAALLDTSPLVAAALLPAGPLPRTGSYAFRRPTEEDADRTADGVARLIATHSGMALTIGTLDQLAYQLVLQARWHDGAISRDEALAELPASAEVLDRAAQQLADGLITDPGLGWVVLRPGFADVVPLPGIALLARSKAITTDRLAEALRQHGVEIPPRKPERIEALRAVLGDDKALDRALSGLSAAARSLFELMVTRCTEPPHQVKLGDIGISYFSPYAAQRTWRWTPSASCTASLLVGVDDYDQTAWVWLETLVARRGGLSANWPSQPTVTPVPIDRAGAGPQPPASGHGGPAGRLGGGAAGGAQERWHSRARRSCAHQAPRRAGARSADRRPARRSS